MAVSASEIVGSKNFDNDVIPVTGFTPNPQRTESGEITGETTDYPTPTIRYVVDARDVTEPAPPPGRRERILRPLRTIFSAVNASSAAR